MSTIAVYQADILGFFLYETIAHELALAPDYYNIPFGAYVDAPPAAASGMIARRIGEEWVLVEDHRDGVFFVVESNARYTIGAPATVDGIEVQYDGGGAVPEWLTDIEPVIEEPLPEPTE